MSHSRQANYLESKILTAPPHRLHLMLIEGAIRIGRQAASALQNGDHSTAGSLLMRMLDILGELLAGVREQKSALNEQLADVYWFLFRRVSEAKIRGDGDKLVEVLDLLEYERHTWQMVCDKLAAECAPAAPMLRANHRSPLTSPSNLSLEA